MNRKFKWLSVVALALLALLLLPLLKRLQPAETQPEQTLRPTPPAPAAQLVTQQATVNRVPHLPATGPQAAAAAAATAPAPQRPHGGTVIAYRTALLPPKVKGEPAGELREWLIRPQEGYTSHLEEVWRPDASGSMAFESSREYAANQVLLTLDGETDLDALTAALEAAGYTVKDPLFDLEKGGRILAVLSPEIAFETVAELMDRVKAFDPKITVEEDFAVYTSRIPDDARYRALWAMEKIRAPEAWEIATEAPETVVAVLDTGVNYLHEDLTENILRDKETFDYPYINGYRSIGGYQTYDPMDDNGHGSHCAGTIAASGNNGLGVAGVTWKTKIMPLKALDYEGKGFHSDIIICMTYARKELVDVISCSFGGGGKSAAMEQAIRQLGIMGTTLVCAAGNDSLDNDKTGMYPASYDLENIIAVASTGTQDQLSGFSNYGATTVDIGAPGEGILSTCISPIAVSKAYETLSGTSMATPHVAGALTLLKGTYPTDEPIQSIQRLLLNAADCEALAGITTTGKRLDLFGAIESRYPPAPIIQATAGVYEDRVEVSWKPVAKATWYRLYRMWSEGGEKELLMDWSTDCSFVDTTAEKDVGYHYYVQCSDTADENYLSPLSKAGVGYKLQPVLDAWDTADDTPAGATVLIPTSEVAEQGEHSLSPKDTADWYRIEMTKGQSYTFTSVGASDIFAELFNAPTGEKADRVTYDDDSAGDYQFTLTYTAPSDGTCYLRVTPRNAENCYYKLRYQIVGWQDEWDPADDTFSGATELTLTEGETVKHGLHELSSADAVDWFTFTLEAGKTYTFLSTGDSDTVAELYSGSGAAGNLVAFNDDGHDAAEGKLNFRLIYTPAETGTYYLKVTTALKDTPAAYHLLVSVTAEDYDFTFTPASIVSAKGWGSNPFITTGADGTEAVVDAEAGTALLLKWAFNEDLYRAVTVPVTNLVELYGASGERIAWGEAVYNGTMDAGTFVDFVTELPELPAGSYRVTMTLNASVSGEASLPEANRENNVHTLAFTVFDPDSAVTGLEITGNVTVPAKGSARYRAMATFADGTIGEVAPTWTLIAGTEWATLSADGLLEVAALSQTREATLRAVYRGLVTEKTVILSPEQTEVESPFGEVVRYPSLMASVDATVLIDGAPAAPGDLLAAFSGDELRGTAKIAADGTVTIAVSVAHSAEAITFKVFDASEGDEGLVLACAETLVLSPGDSRDNVVLTATAEDPFGPAAGEDGEGELCTIYLRAEMKSNAIRPGDMVAAYQDARLLAKQRLSFTGDFKHGKKGYYSCALTFRVEEACDLAFLLWRRVNRKYHTSTELFRVEPGKTYGTPEEPVEITFDTGHKRSFRFPKKGWYLVSFGLNPDNPAYGSVFTADSGIDQVKQTGDAWSVGDETDGTVSGLAAYWLHTSQDDLSWEISGEPETATSLPVVPGWNLVGYPLERSGRIERVLRQALEEKLILQVADGNSVYPRGNLTMMHPGRGYWLFAASAGTVTFESTGMVLTAGTLAGTTYGPFGDGESAVRAPVEPTRYTQTVLMLGGSPAGYGDCVALYTEADELAAVARVESEDGSVSFPLYAECAATYRAVLWNAESGLDSPQLFEADAPFTVTADHLGAEISGMTLTFPTAAFSGGGDDPSQEPETEPVTFTVTFDPDGKAVRSGGGELTQEVPFGGSAEAPELTVTAGWEFLGWNAPLSDIRADRTVKARYKAVSPEEGTTQPKPTGTLVYHANGGVGDSKEVTTAAGESVTLEANTFEREEYVFIGWGTAPSGGTVLPADGTPAADLRVEADETVDLYAQWAYAGFSVSAPVYVCNDSRPVTVPVIFDSAEAVACISIKVAYNPDLLEVRKVTAGTLAARFADDFTVSEPKPGLLAISLFAADDTVSGRGTVADITFVPRPGSAGHFSDVTISDLQLADRTGVKDVTVDKAVVTENGMVRILETTAEAAQFEQAQIIAADTELKRLILSEGDRIQASDTQTPIVITETVTSLTGGPVQVLEPVQHWAAGEYELLKTVTAGLTFTLLECPYPWTVTECAEEGVVTYVATVVKEESVEVESADGEALPAGTKNRLRELLAGELPAAVTKLSVSGPAGMVPLIVEMGIAPALTVSGTEAEAHFRMPTIEITSFNPASGKVRIKVLPGSGNRIVSEIATGYLHVYGSETIGEKMRYISKVGFDLTPYLKAESKGEAVLSITLGNHTFLKVKVEAEQKAEGDEE